MGTFGLFFTCFFLFAKYFPTIAIAEIKYVLKTTGESYKADMTAIEKESASDFAHKVHAH
jgi:molybdopterin-containing oxidoreductase family membrane subunit